MALGYPRQSLGWSFQQLLCTWDIPQSRLARHLAISPTDLIGLALCPVPPVDSPDFATQIDRLAYTFGIAPWRLAFVCRAASLRVPRVGE